MNFHQITRKKNVPGTNWLNDTRYVIPTNYLSSFSSSSSYYSIILSQIQKKSHVTSTNSVYVTVYSSSSGTVFQKIHIITFENTYAKLFVLTQISVDFQFKLIYLKKSGREFLIGIGKL